MTLYDRLRAEKRCPVCGDPAGPETEQTNRLKLVRYKCTASFGYSAILDKIVAHEPCPTASNLAAVHMTLEAEAEAARRNALKEEMVA